MSKVGFWFKGSQGKLAGATMYKSNGETIMREVVKPSNPRTQGQLIQRIVMTTVQNAYSTMKTICDHSFEGMKKGSDTMSYFMKRNIASAREAISRMQSEGVQFYDMFNFLPLGAKGFAPNQYVLSMGSLPQIFASIGGDEDDHYYAGHVRNVTENTYAGVCEALGLQRGDQLTFIFINNTETQSALNVKFNFARIILDPIDENGLQLPMSTAFIDGAHVNAPSPRNEGELTIGIGADEGLWFGKGTAVVVACAVIASRKQGDSWLRSTSVMAYGQSGFNMSLGEALDRAEAGNDVYVPNAQYLNNAGQGGIVQQEQTQNPFTVSSVTCGGTAVVVGTPLAVETSESKNLVVAATNTDGVTLKLTRQGAEDETGAFDNGTAPLAVPAPTATSPAYEEWTLYAVVNGDDVAMGYSVRMSKPYSGLPGGGGGGEG